MISIDNTNKLHRGIIEGQELTTKALNSYGFNSRDINRLIEQGKIRRVKRGHYEFLDVEALFHFGKYLIRKDRRLATECFKKCLELDGNHGGANFQLFINSIFAKDYVRAFEYFDIFYENGRTFYKNDANLYLFLLSHITSLPTKYRACLEEFSLENMRVDSEDKRYLDSILENRIRMNVLQKRFSRALNQLNEKIKNNRRSTLQDFITRELLRQAGIKEDLHRKETMKLARERKYESLLKIYRERCCPTDMEKYILKLLRTILNIKEANDIPKKTDTKDNYLYDLIDSNNFELALKVSTEFYIQKGVNPFNNILILLLSAICEMIKDLESKVEPPKATLVSESPKEDAFAKYTKLFFESLKRDNFDAARRYLAVLSEEEQTSKKPTMTKYLHNLLSSSQKIIDSKRSAASFLEATKSAETLPTPSTVTGTLSEEKDIDTETQRDIEYIEAAYQSLIRGEGMILLETHDQERTKRLLQIAEYYPDVESFAVEDEQGQRRVMMRYVPLQTQRFDYKTAAQSGRVYYEEREYDKCIREYMRLLQLREARAYTYAMIGLSYMRKQDLKRAIDFLIVATDLDRKERNHTNYTDLIKRLRIKLALENRPLEEQTDNHPENYDLDIITTYILEFDLDVETACRNLGMRPDTALMVMIEYAKAYYTQGELDKGDQFLKVVEKSDCKTKESLRALREVQRDKKFYANRTREESTPIPRTIKPVNPK